MAILENCYKCNKEFSTSAGSGKCLCDNCDGTNERKLAEIMRWDALSEREKIHELLLRVEALEQRSQWDGRLG